jgi:hypothetical protein
MNAVVEKDLPGQQDLEMIFFVDLSEIVNWPILPVGQALWTHRDRRRVRVRLAHDLTLKQLANGKDMLARTLPPLEIFAGAGRIRRRRINLVALGGRLARHEP